jgi:phosphoglycerol transferase MdoB-like AlkP superfamily enzyme
MIKIPKLIRWIFSIGIIFLSCMTLLRFCFYVYFNHGGNTFSGLGNTFLMGLRYDTRMVCILLALLLLLGCLNVSDPFLSNRGKRIGFFVILVAGFALALFYIVDFAYYSYLSQRLAASALGFLQDAGISLKLVWQTYPVIRLLLLLAAGTFLLWWLTALSFRRISRDRTAAAGTRKWIWVVATLLLLGVGIMGRIGQFPLRWSDAFALGSDYRANLALNPFQSFFSSLKFRNAGFSLSKTKAAYPLLQPYFAFSGRPDSPDYDRSRTGRPPGETGRPNIVIVICESFSAYKSSMWGNPLNTTPFFKEMCDQGIFFDHCFTPSYGTARGVWAVITGIPDVGDNSTSSRNPAAVDQHTIMDDFDGYDKMYFLGGSTSWANIRGLLTNNIRGLRIYEQEDFNSPKVDVWGISDKNLFLEANRVLSRRSSPFIAVIQTADNHRPYTIPEEDVAEFKTLTVAPDSLKQFGFESNAEMNAFRYTDFCYKKFMEAARAEKYFRNTIFLFVGDHGIAGNAADMFPKPWTTERLTNMHVPLLIYSPGRVKPARVSLNCSQVDLLPTAAGLAGISYHNTALGRDLLDSGYGPGKALSFLYDPDQGYIGLVKGSYIFRSQLQTHKEQIASIRNNDPPSEAAGKDTLAAMSALTGGIYETAKYLLLNNKKKY